MWKALQKFFLLSLSTLTVAASAGNNMLGEYLCISEEEGEEELSIEKPNEHYRVFFQSDDDWLIADGKTHQLPGGSYHGYVNDSGQLIFKTLTETDFGTAKGTFTFASKSKTELTVDMIGKVESPFGNETVEIHYDCKKDQK